jgi:hypothetical protein
VPRLSVGGEIRFREEMLNVWKAAQVVGAPRVEHCGGVIEVSMADDHLRHIEGIEVQRRKRSLDRRSHHQLGRVRGDLGLK